MLSSYYIPFPELTGTWQSPLFLRLVRIWHSFLTPGVYAAGLTPGNNESAGKKKSVRITRAGVYLKPALVQVAHAAAKLPYYKIKYEYIMKRRGKKRAIIAIARMILTAAYQMLSNGEVWNPTNLYKVDMPDPLKEKQKEKAIKQAKKLLIAERIIDESLFAS